MVARKGGKSDDLLSAVYNKHVEIVNKVNSVYTCIILYYTSSKKHFMKNVKECRDVNRTKSIRTRSGCYRHTSHTLWTHSIVRIVRAL